MDKETTVPRDNLTDSDKMRSEVLRLVHEEIERLGLRITKHEADEEKTLEKVNANLETIVFTAKQNQEWQAALREQYRELSDNTKKSHSMLKTIMSIFKFAGKEAERH